MTKKNSDQKNGGAPVDPGLQADNDGMLWEVFLQPKPGLAHKHMGNVHAADGEMALQNARDVYTRRKEGTSIWVVPATAVVASRSEEADAFFDPADTKVYRHPTFYNLKEGVKFI